VISPSFAAPQLLRFLQTNNDWRQFAFSL